MALDIAQEKVAAVLLPDGVWHHVVTGTFELDGYSFAGSPEHSGEKSVTTTGARWKQADSIGTWTVCCPITSILAVRYDKVRNTG